MNPYIVLGVPRNSDDPTIRRAYLEAVKLAPPDHDPKRFKAVSTAYTQIKDETSRNRYALFDRSPPGETPLDTLIGYLRLRPHFKPLPAQIMKQFLRTCAKS